MRFSRSSSLHWCLRAVTRPHCSTGLADMRALQKRFMAAYHLSPETAPPLVSLNFEGSGGAIDTDKPFELVPWGVDSD